MGGAKRSRKEARPGEESFRTPSRRRNWLPFLRKMRSRDGGALSRGNRLELYFWGDPAFDAMLAAIEGARRTVHLDRDLHFHGG